MYRIASGRQSSTQGVKTRQCSKLHLSCLRSALVELMQKLNHGRIEGLIIRGGEPVLDPSPCRRRTMKFGSENGPRPEIAIEDFVLKVQVVELFDYFDRLQNGIIDVLEVKHGLPFCMIVTEAAA